MRELLEKLPSLQLNAQGDTDFLASSPVLLAAIAENADDAAACINRGLSAIGSLLAHSAPQIEDGTIAYDAIEAIGWLFAELGSVTAECIGLSAQCRQANATRKANELKTLASRRAEAARKRRSLTSPQPSTPTRAQLASAPPL